MLVLLFSQPSLQKGTRRASNAIPVIEELSSTKERYLTMHAESPSGDSAESVRVLNSYIFKLFRLLAQACPGPEVCLRIK